MFKYSDIGLDVCSFLLQSQAKRLAGKNVSEMTCSVSSGM